MEFVEARDMVSALANGANPVNGEILPAESPYNEPKIIRALFLVLNSVDVKPARKTPDERMQDNLAAGRPKNAGLPWTEELRAEVARKFTSGKKLQDLAKHFERTSGAIHAELARQGLVDPVGGQQFGKSAQK